MNCSYTKWYAEPGRYTITVRVPDGPFAKEAEVALVDYGIQVAREQQAQKVLLAFDDKRPDLPLLAYERGYPLLVKFLVTALEVKTFAPATHVSTLPASIQITRIGQMEEEGIDWRPLYFEAFREILRDVPTGEEMTDTTWDDFLEMIDEPERFQARSTFVAIENGKIVGLSELCPSLVDPSIAQTGLTGVRREHRRRGIAQSLKITAICWAKEQGIRLIATDNASINPMYDLNLRLGFHDQFSVQLHSVD